MVLFDVGVATLRPEARSQFARVADVIFDVADDIPDDIDWVLRVDGHADAVPLTGRGPRQQLGTAAGPQAVRRALHDRRDWRPYLRTGSWRRDSASGNPSTAPISTPPAPETAGSN